jgi:hypothetical protein
LIEAHCAVLCEIKGAAGLEYLLSSTSASFSVGTTRMPVEMSGDFRLDTSSRNTASANGRKNEPPPAVPTQGRVVTGPPLLQDQVDQNAAGPWLIILVDRVTRHHGR